MPHYTIQSKKPDAENATLRVVEAKNQARALAHVVEDTLTVRLAEPRDFVALTRANGEIETAK